MQRWSGLTDAKPIDVRCPSCHSTNTELEMVEMYAIGRAEPVDTVPGEGRCRDCLHQFINAEIFEIAKDVRQNSR